MTLSFTLSTIFEILLITAVAWAIFNENKLIAFEKNLLALIKRRRLKVVKTANTCNRASYIYNNDMGLSKH